MGIQMDPIEYVRLVQFNEMMMGQTKEFIETTNETYGLHFFAEHDNAHICITGLEKRVYTPHYGIPTSVYVNTYQEFQDMLKTKLTEWGCKADVALMIYSPNKQIAILFSRTASCEISPLEIAERIHRLQQEIFDQGILKGISRTANFTALSHQMTAYEEIGATFQETMDLHQLSFFLMEELVLTAARRAELHRPLTAGEAADCTQTLLEHVRSGEVEQAVALCRDLFLHKIRYSFNFYLCVDVLTSLKQQLYHLAEAHDVEVTGNLQEIFVLKGKLDIQDLCEQCEAVIGDLAGQLRRSGKQRSYITQEALRFLRHHFHEEISLVDMAKYVNVVPSYLSRIFNREMGVSVTAYLTGIRMQRAKELLTETNRKVFEVGNAVGIFNYRHFISVFKKQVGMTPQEYREGKNGVEALENDQCKAADIAENA